MEEAMDKNNPLLERLTFFSIFQTNLDEFFMVRVGALFEQMVVKPKNVDNKTKKTAAEQIEMIFEKVRQLENIRDVAFRDILIEMQKNKISYITARNATEQDVQFLRKYFKKEIKPFLVPIVLSKNTPFPFLNQKLIHICTALSDKEKDRFGIIPVDENIKRFIELPSVCGELRFALAEDLILFHADKVFKNYELKGKSLFRLIRNADLDESEASFDHDIDYRDFMSTLLKKRKKQSPVRLQLSEVLPINTLDFLVNQFELKLDVKQIFYTQMPLDYSPVFTIKDLNKDASLRFSRYVPQQPVMVKKNSAMFSQIRKKDILLCYPYENIKPFIKLLEEAASDKYVKSIKITLYRLAKNSKVIESLVTAVENGKEVTVLVELRARFDEENNIGWSRKLEHAGCKVIHGPAEYKVHSKLLLITRQVPGADLEYFTQIGTGNYNEKTSVLYTDFSLLTHNLEIGKDAEKLFKILTKNITNTPAISTFDPNNFLDEDNKVSNKQEHMTLMESIKRSFSLPAFDKEKFLNSNFPDVINEVNNINQSSVLDENGEDTKNAKDKHSSEISEPAPVFVTRPEFRHLLVAPLNLREKVIEMIDEQIENAKNNLPAYVGAKLNSLTDKLIIEKLIDAGKAGVKIELLVRGICCVVAGVAEHTENITVKSIVGRFLEHSRVYIFGADENRKIYISSADYMTRNTIRRVEVAAPILDKKVKDRIFNMFCIMLNDNVKGRIMQSDGNYVKDTLENSEPLNSQEEFCG
ncbi:hypothetical protein FACS1894132_14060 [Clostridia bacterium]|nr:hypothetical protein FACS1894132_14060 [Clostridia bacterium]